MHSRGYSRKWKILFALCFSSNLCSKRKYKTRDLREFSLRWKKCPPVAAKRMVLNAFKIALPRPSSCSPLFLCCAVSTVFSLSTSFLWPLFHAVSQLSSKCIHSSSVSVDQQLIIFCLHLFHPSQLSELPRLYRTFCNNSLACTAGPCVSIACRSLRQFLFFLTIHLHIQVP